jgi:hypothetical protein
MIVKLQRSFLIALLPGLLFAGMRTVTAQSSDQSLPTPVLTNEINGKIAALDLGDPRLTRQFYAFEGVPGDLEVTLNSKNLNGDLDIFTAVTFRPLIKITMYANSQAPQVTKSFYLRTRQVLILRVEARTPNDDDGSYQIRFSGAFEPFSGGIPVAENTEQSSEAARATDRKTKRLSSVGARIEEPAAGVSPAATEAKPANEKPVEKPAEETAAKTSPPAKTAKTKATRTRPAARPARGRRTSSAQSKSAEAEPAKPSPAEPEASKKEAPREEEQKAGVVTSGTPKTPEKPAAQEPVTAQPGARLIIEEKDGTKIDRPMSTVRRIVIEGGVIVIVLRTGRVERVPMSVVARMAIEP